LITQAVVPDAQFVWQAPFVQVMPDAQATPQAPQFCVSLCTLLQPPLLGQYIWPVEQLFTHWP
jgi:hypothetical protein